MRDRTLRWLRKHGYLDERAAEDRSNAPAEPSALEGCAQLALEGCAFLAKPFEPRQAADADLERIEEMKDGRISYLMKTARRGSTHRVMTPMEFTPRGSAGFQPAGSRRSRAA